MTFSFRPRRLSSRPVTAASVNTRVVSWNEAADTKDSVASDALVMPSSRRSNSMGCLPSASSRSFSSRSAAYCACSPRTKDESPGFFTSALRSICRTITSMCLLLIATPCSRYTS